MNLCFFVSDLHGSRDRYQKLFDAIAIKKPAAVFLGGDLLPDLAPAQASHPQALHHNFIHGFLADTLNRLKQTMGESFPELFIVMGNGDARFLESSFLDIGTTGLWHYIHNRCIVWKDYTIYGYAFVPPTPLTLKDWERFDMACYTDPGCTPPSSGIHTVPLSQFEIECATIQHDLKQLTNGQNLSKSIFLFHTPPYQTALDRAALDGIQVDYVPLDVHVGSVAVKRLIQHHQPLITLHGHIHESPRLTGQWRDSIGSTALFSAAHDGPELSLIEFDPEAPEKATRQLLQKNPLK